MLAVKEARNLVKSANFEQINKVFIHNVPKEEIDNTDETVMLIRDVSTDTELDGNEDFYATNREIEVQIFYSINMDYDPESLETKMLKLFKANHWSITQIQEHVADPDTFQMTATFYFTQFHILQEE